MPFTVSHIAAVVPLHRPLSRLHVFTAAVIGSMVPDFGMLLPGTLAHWQTHGLQALFSFCLPVGLCAYGLTQLLIRPALLEVLPDRAYARLRAEEQVAVWDNPRIWLWVLLALLFGALTHLVWDAFTHEDARGVLMFPMLSDYGPEVGGRPMHVYRWLQYGSSVFGLIVVGAALLLWLRHAPEPLTPPPRHLRRWERRMWMALYLLLPLAVIAWAMLQSWWIGHFPLAPLDLTRIAIIGMRGAAMSLLLVSAVILARLAA